jgi:hypothetical protein
MIFFFLSVMDDPIFLQEIQKTFYSEDQVKSIEQITSEYLGNPALCRLRFSLN